MIGFISIGPYWATNLSRRAVYSPVEGGVQRPVPYHIGGMDERRPHFLLVGRVLLPRRGIDVAAAGSGRVRVRRA